MIGPLNNTVQLTLGNIAFPPSGDEFFETYAHLDPGSPGRKTLLVDLIYTAPGGAGTTASVYLDVEVEVGDQTFTSEFVQPLGHIAAGRLGIARIDFDATSPFAYTRVRIARRALDSKDTYKGNFAVHSIEFSLFSVSATPLQELVERTWSDHDVTDPPVVFDLVHDPAVEGACPRSHQ